jgi:sugar fermentation stimulation protein A
MVFHTIINQKQQNGLQMKPSLLNSLTEKGVYTLVIHVPAGLHLTIGRLGKHRFKKGCYAYTGSALGIGVSSLKNRVTRHLQKKKSKFWHVDHLLAHKEIVVTAVIVGRTSEKLECKINKRLKTTLTAETPILGFGASDCKENCGSHLLYLGEKDAKNRIASIYKEVIGSQTAVVDLTKI